MCLWAVRSVHSTRYYSADRGIVWYSMIVVRLVHGKGGYLYLSRVPGVSQKYGY